MMTMVIMVFVVLGLYTYNKIGVELFPDIEAPFITVVTSYPGAGAEEIETQVTKPLEEGFASLSKLKNMYSFASEGQTTTMLEFDLSANADQAMLDAQKKVDLLKGRLPEETGDPVVIKMDMNDQPVMILAMSSSRRPLTDTFNLAEDVIKDRLQKLAGVADVRIVGGQSREVQINLDRSRLQGYGLSVAQVINRLRMENLNQPSGRLDRPEAEYNVRTIGEFKDVQDIANQEIPLEGGASVALRNLGTITDGYHETREYSRLNGDSAIGLMIFKQSDASVVDVGRQVRAELQKIEAELPADVKLKVSTDFSEWVQASLNDTRKTIFEGIITVALALFLFLREWRPTAIVLVAIPTSLIATLMLIYFAGFTFNFLSLMGLALCIGILVDDSIVVLENIFRHLKMGKNPVQAAIDGRTEIGMAAVAITLSDIVVFAPIAFMGGVVGQFFRQFGLTIVFATLFSLFISFTLTPMLASRLFKNTGSEVVTPKKQRFRIMTPVWNFFTKLGDGVKDAYLGLLTWSLGHRKKVLALAVVVFLASLSLIPLKLIGFEFMPKADQSAINVNVEMPIGTPLAKTDGVMKELEQYLKTIPEIKDYHTTVGTSGGIIGAASGSHIGRIGVQLYPKKERQRTVWQIGDEIRHWAKSFNGGKVTVSESDTMGGPGGAGLEVWVSGPNPQQLVEVANDIKQIVKETPGTTDVDTNWRLGQPEVQVLVDRRRAMAAGVSINDVARTLRASLSGEKAGQLRQNDDETDLIVRVDGLNKADLNSIKNLSVATQMGSPVELQQVAEVRLASGPTEIRRTNRQRTITVTANFRDRSLGEVSGDVQQRIAKYKMPSGYSIEYGGQSRSMGDTFIELIKALILSIVLVYMVLVMLYESYLTPFIRMVSLPLGIVGALLALALTGNNLGMFPMIGIIMLDGLVAKNGTLLIDYTHTLMERGLSLREALLEASKTRLRPIMMTTVTMVFGMLPAALSTGEGSENRVGMSWILIGGLITSTVFTLLIIPVLYTLLDDFKRRMSRSWQRFRNRSTPSAGA